MHSRCNNPASFSLRGSGADSLWPNLPHNCLVGSSGKLSRGCRTLPKTYGYSNQCSASLYGYRGTTCGIDSTSVDSFLLYLQVSTGLFISQWIFTIAKLKTFQNLHKCFAIQNSEPGKVDIYFVQTSLFNWIERQHAYIWTRRKQQLVSKNVIMCFARGLKSFW